MALNVYNDDISIRKTVNDLLFEGYEDVLLNLANFLPSSLTEVKVPFDKFGYCYPVGSFVWQLRRFLKFQFIFSSFSSAIIAPMLQVFSIFTPALMIYENSVRCTRGTTRIRQMLMLRNARKFMAQLENFNHYIYSQTNRWISSYRTFVAALKWIMWKQQRWRAYEVTAMRVANAWSIMVSDADGDLPGQFAGSVDLL